MRTWEIRSGGIFLEIYERNYGSKWGFGGARNHSESSTNWKRRVKRNYEPERQRGQKVAENRFEIDGRHFGLEICLFTMCDGC